MRLKKGLKIITTGEKFVTITKNTGEDMTHDDDKKRKAIIRAYALYFSQVLYPDVYIYIVRDVNTLLHERIVMLLHVYHGGHFVQALMINNSVVCSA